MRTAWLLLALNLLLGALLNAAVEARTAHFRVITALEPAIAETAARELENIRSAYRALGLADDRLTNEPLAVVIFRDVPELEEQTGYRGGRPGFTRGLHQKGADRDFIAIAWNAAGPPATALAHEYAHQLFDPESRPLWFREGMAEVLSEAARTGSVLSVGGPLPKWIAPLLRDPWIPLQELLASSTHSPLLAHPNFYAQCWLLVDWLASREPDLKKLDAAVLRRRIDRDGIEYVERLLREHLRQPGKARTTVTATPSDPAVRLRPIESAEAEFWIADLLRELGHRDEARCRLEALERTHPGLPEAGEALGAMAMDNGRYEEAETHLATAVARGSSNPRTHYRYSLLLMRPAGAHAVERGQKALSHARLARLGDPSEPRYVLTEAQASMIAGEWEAAAGLLGKLAAIPGWRLQAEIELSELGRRKQHELRREGPPPLAGEADHARALVIVVPEIAAPSKPKPLERADNIPARRAEVPSAWPPPGTMLLAGRIGGVECRAGKKIVTVNSPLFRTRLLLDDQARLYYPPLKWRELPCGTRGWVVNAAYRPVQGLDGTRGVLVALLF